jgi:hypothetical protein
MTRLKNFERPAPELVIEVTADVYGVLESDITGTSRTEAVCAPRFVAAYVMRRFGYSQRQIAIALKKQDHSTIGNAIRTVKKRMDLKDVVLKKRVRRILETAESLHRERNLTLDCAPEDRARRDLQRQRQSIEMAIRKAERRGVEYGGSIDEKECYGMTYRELVAASVRLLRQLEIYHPDMHGV